MKFTKKEIKLAGILLTVIMTIIVGWLCMELYFITGIIICVIGLLLIWLSAWWREKDTLLGITYPLKKKSKYEDENLTIL